MKHGEAINIIFRNSSPSFYDILDITISLKNIESNLTLSVKSLLNLAKIFQLSKELRDYFYKDFLDPFEYPILSDLFSQLYTNKGICDKVFSCILDETTLADNASKNLQSIRKQKRNLEQDIKNKLNDFIHSSSYSKYIQEPIVTIRNDRFVIPIKESYKSKIKGFVHDISNAGSTVFIEPITIFDMNNELNQLKILEELEIEKILQELTQLFYPYIENLKNDYELIGKLDFIFAKAKYAKSIHAFIPQINTSMEIHLIEARHPLIDPDKVVPISLDLGKDFSCLLITGPNTGGKTVTLKTVGLLTFMACSGLAIPCKEQSSIYVFDSIFTDIGDNQSIQESLSTFSSHMLNVIKIVENATSNSLVLVDELGSGTDPLEGANLAISILEYLKNLGCLVIATTHYQELKQYSLVSNGFKNASVEFDLSTLSPTYRLLIGIPGKSNAFEISEKLGLKKEIIEKAKSFMTHEQINFEELLKNIYDNKSILDKEKLELEKELQYVSELRKSLEEQEKAIKEQSENLIHDSKIKAKNILLDAKEEANDLIKKMNQTSDIKELNQLRNQLNKEIKEIYFEKENFSSVDQNEVLKPEDIFPNMPVFITNLGQNGIVISQISKSNEVQVQIGNIKTYVNIKYLQKIKDFKLNPKVSSSYSNISKSKNIHTEINVIGLNVEEATFVVDKFLDDCSLAKLSTVRIVHGKGTGKLREGIHKFLKNHPHVKSFRIGTYGEGEMGVTIVELK